VQYLDFINLDNTRVLLLLAVEPTRQRGLETPHPGLDHNIRQLFVCYWTFKSIGNEWPLGITVQFTEWHW